MKINSDLMEMSDNIQQSKLIKQKIDAQSMSDLSMLLFQFLYV